MTGRKAICTRCGGEFTPICEKCLDSPTLAELLTPEEAREVLITVSAENIFADSTLAAMQHPFCKALNALWERAKEGE